ncbi:MAG TPA: AAA family ATPase [Streptosporangiaceae bacterium]|nr:AAA family ATPase [Streptosporangiaceae bacterium]
MRRAAQDGFGHLRQRFAAAPVTVKVVTIAALLIIASLIGLHPTRLLGVIAGVLLVAGLVYGPFAVARGRESVAASLSVAVLGLALVTIWYETEVHQQQSGAALLAAALPFAVVAGAHAGSLGRWLVPCRTVAWALLWAIPVLFLASLIPGISPLVGVALAWALALMVLGWRLAKSMLAGREFGREHSRAAALAAPHSGTLPRTPPRPNRPGTRPGGPRPGPAGPGHTGPGPGLTGRPGAAPDLLAGEQVRGVRGGDPARPRAGAGTAASNADQPQPPAITVDEAMAELDAMIGLSAVKDQVRSIAASIEAARRRALAGYGTEKPMQHFVFLGPPGTGKTAVARIIAKIFYAFGLLETPAVVEAHRADLVGEYLGATAIKTNELVDSALGGVLFIDEAYSLVNEGDGQGDRFGNEAVQTLLKRAEDDRDDLIIILAGYEKQMESFLSSNPGLTSRFAIRVSFPGYTPAELLQLADAAMARRGELLDPDARPVLWRMFEDVGRRRLTDELGNGRFVRSLLEKAGQARDVRVMSASEEPSPSDLVTIQGGDLERAFTELSSRFRGYRDTPSLESALAELDELIGLDPVKRQVHEITAQLQVARLRDRQGLASQPPARHFVFTGPPGTGKTTVARILGRIFAALGLLVRPSVVEAHRADLVGEHLGSTAIKTNKLVDSALGAVLFIDEAYSLYNDGYSGGDAFGAEAVQTLLKRAEDDRDRLVIVLAGYTADMDRFLRSNPGLASRFGVRIGFPSYTPQELVRIAEMIAQQAGDSFADDALPVLDDIFRRACDEGRIDELGNGRFARSLFERACASRDLRIAHLGETASAADLTTISAADLLAAYREVSSQG